MSHPFRSVVFVKTVVFGAGISLFTLGVASANLLVPRESTLRSGPSRSQISLLAESVQISLIEPQTDWIATTPVRLATEMSDVSFSPEGLRELTGPAKMGPEFGPRRLGGLRPNRLLLWGGFSAAAVVEAFRQSQAAWGASNGRFHFKADFKGDGLAMTDEASHMLVAYRLSGLIESGYRWSGIEPSRARRLAFAETWLLTFLVEYPIDAYNPQQGFGVSDLLFNTLGTIAAYGHSIARNPRWDLKVSVKPSFFNGTGRVIAYNNKQYDDFIYWLTYRPLRTRTIPLLIGAGYSTSHHGGSDPTKELRLGIGSTLSEIGGLIGPQTQRLLRPLDFFFFNLAAKFSWR